MGGPFRFQGLQHAPHEVVVRRRFLADVALAPAVHLDAGEQLGLGLAEGALVGVGRAAVEFYIAGCADPEDMVVVAVLARCEQSSQLIDSRLIVQIHVKAPLTTR